MPNCYLICAFCQLYHCCLWSALFPLYINFILHVFCMTKWPKIFLRFGDYVSLFSIPSFTGVWICWSSPDVCILSNNKSNLLWLIFGIFFYHWYKSNYFHFVFYILFSKHWFINLYRYYFNPFCDSQLIIMNFCRSHQLPLNPLLVCRRPRFTKPLCP